MLGLNNKIFPMLAQRENMLKITMASLLIKNKKYASSDKISGIKWISDLMECLSGSSSFLMTCKSHLRVVFI